MITWLQNFFLKHNKILFGSLLIVIIVTFVLTIGPQSFFGSGPGSQREELKYYGYDLTSETDQRAMAFTAEVSAILHPELQLRRENLMDYAYLRVAALGIAAQLGIPDPDKEAMREYIESLSVFEDRQTGEFSAESYQRMLDALESNARYNRESIVRVLKEDFRIAEVRKALGGPSYSLPFEAMQDYTDNLTEYDFNMAKFDYAAFSPDLEITDEALEQFYKENPARYEIPETISVTAIFFRADAYADEADVPTEEELEAYFAQNKSRYEAPDPVEENPESPEETEPELTLADVRDAVMTDIIKERAAAIGARKSEQFSLSLWQDGIALDSPEFSALVEQFEATEEAITPYSREVSPRMTDVPANLLDSMWIYTTNPNRYFSDIAQIADGAVILVTHGVTESRIPPFEEVRETVSGEFSLSEKRRLFAESGADIKQVIEEKLAEQGFDEIAGAEGLELIVLEPFTGETIDPQLRRGNLWEQARYLEENEVSDMVIRDDTGYFIHLAAKTVPEIDMESDEYQAYLENRTAVMNEVMGWSRLREITDQSLASLLGTPEAPAAP